MNKPATHSVLIVEDERVIATDIQQTLQGMGYDAFAIASSAEEALTRVSERIPDLVLMDIRIEGAHDGIEAAELMRALHDVPVIFLTAHADAATIERAKKAEPYAFLAKPVKPADLRGAIEMSVYRQAIDRRLRERERWFATTLNCVADGVITTDLQGRITYLNPAAEQLLGTRTDNVVGKPAEEVMRLVNQSPDSPDKTPLSAALRLGKPMRLVSAQLVNLSTGAHTSISDTSAPVFVDGEMTGAVMVFHDDTEKRAVARQLEIKDRLAALGTMAAGTAHELNNPLAIITGRAENAAEALRRHTAELGKRNPPVDEGPELRGVSYALADIEAAAGRMARIVADLSQISRPRPSALQTLNLAHCIEWAVRATAHEFRNRARVEKRLGAIPPVLADDARLGQVLVNLLVNAAHSIAPGDVQHNVVVISTRTDESGRAAISIRDTGQGMAPEVLKRIFDPFFTTKDIGAGTGLGLAISHGIVSSLGGTLRADSEPGKGSTFEILLPRAPDAPAQAARAPAAGPGPQAEATHLGRVLVVDDEVALLRAVGSTLESDGYSVVTLSNAREALAMIDRGEQFDAILSDLSMPDMTGMDFHTALEKKNPRLAQRMVFMSGGSVTPDAERFLKSLANRYVAKPFRGADLRRALREVLGKA